MPKAFLYKKLINATESIIKQFGQGIIREERFVNILSDLNPDRDNPALFKIIKSAIHDGFLNSVLNSNIKSIKNEVATAASALSKQNGYDQTLVESILFSLAVGYGTITAKEYNSITNTKSKPTQQNPTPNKQKSKPQSPSKYKATIKDEAILLWGMLGLLASPVVYAHLISSQDCWPMGASIAIAALHFFTILPVSISFGSDTAIKSKRVHPALHGGYCALYMFAIVFWIVFPFLWSAESVQTYWGFLPNKEAFPWMLTWFANLFCALLLSTGLGQGVSSFSSSWRKNKGKFFDNFQDLMTERPYRIGFFAVSAFFLIAAFVLYCIPLAKKAQYNSLIDDFNAKIEVMNQHSDSIRNARMQTERSLSFALFNLGDTFSSCLSKINSNEDYTATSRIPFCDKLTINDVDYISIVDTILHVTTNWNNEDIKVYVYFAKQKLIAIQFSPAKTNGDSILATYTAKYGEPETHLLKISTTEYDRPAYDYDLGYSLMNNRIVPEHFFWTYKNAMLTIDYRPGTHYYSSSYSSFNEGALITYFDRQAETLLQQHKEEQTRKAREYENRRNDSLRLVREAEERQRQEQRRKEELNHQRSMEQI